MAKAKIMTIDKTELIRNNWTSMLADEFITYKEIRIIYVSFFSPEINTKITAQIDLTNVVRMTISISLKYTQRIIYHMHIFSQTKLLFIIDDGWNKFIKNTMKVSTRESFICKEKLYL